MILIVDSNIIIAGLLKNSTTRRLLLYPLWDLYAPETMLKEIHKYEEFIIQKSGLSKNEFEILLNLITENITVVQKDNYNHKLQEADNLIGTIDKGDVPFLALALSIANDGIWTENTKHFKQNKIKIWPTKELVETMLKKADFSSLKNKF